MNYKSSSQRSKHPLPKYFSVNDVRLEQFETICEQSVDLNLYRFADAEQQNIILYNGDKLRDTMTGANADVDIKSELGSCLRDGPGVFVIKGMYSNTAVIDDMTTVFQKILAQENGPNRESKDHFGNNQRIWNSFQKACLQAPELFIDYYGNSLLALVSQAWLGPYYQITAQMNNVKPGGKAQSPHRDYHLGFQSRESAAKFPIHAHLMSQYLTLQGSIAHSDMPKESGPTLFLPFSQQYPAGYLAFHDADFATCFNAHKSQIPLRKGDAIFLNPALFHAAGTNSSTQDRIANLVQISSAFGRPMEMVNRHAMIEKVYPALLERVKQAIISPRTIEDTIAALADGYAFPTNLDSNPPSPDNASLTPQNIMHQALREHWSLEQVKRKLHCYTQQHKA